MEKLQLLTPAKVAELTGFSESKVVRLIKAGKLPAVNTSAGHIKPRYVVRPQDLEAFLTPAPPPAPRERKPRRRKWERIDSHVEQYFG